MDQKFGEPGRAPTPEEEMAAASRGQFVPPQHTSSEATFKFTLPDGCVLTVGPPQGVIRLRLRTLLGTEFYADPELKEMGTAFLSIRHWSTYPSPLVNPSNFEAMMLRFGSEDAIDEFMTAWQQLNRPEFTQIVSQVMIEAVEQGWSQEKTNEVMRARTAPLAKAQLEKIRDLQTTPSS